MKNVLILSGSPRAKGNSNILCDAFMRGAEEAGNQVEKVLVSRLKLSGCLGCNACKRNDGECVQKDDMVTIKEKMIAADVIVLASPIYFYSMTAQLKTFLDRCYAFMEALTGKEFYYIISCAADSVTYTETMVASLRGFTCCLSDSTEKGIIYGINSPEMGDVRKGEAVEQAYEAGKKL